MCNSDFCNLTPEEVLFFATTIASNQAKNLSCEEISALQNIYSQICSALGTIKCQKIFLEKHCSDKKDGKN